MKGRIIAIGFVLSIILAATSLRAAEDAPGNPLSMLSMLQDDSGLLIQYGSYLKTQVGSYTIVFETPYATPPVVLLTPYWKGATHEVGTVETVVNVTPTSFTGASRNAAPTNYVEWVAIGVSRWSIPQVVQALIVNQPANIPFGMKVACFQGPNNFLITLTCPVVQFQGITYWAYSYTDNRVAMGIVGYDEAGEIVFQTEKPGARYVYKITVDTSAKTVTFWGQSDQKITMPWKDLSYRDGDQELSADE